jgi:hypothetical protein
MFNAAMKRRDRFHCKITVRVEPRRTQHCSPSKFCRSAPDEEDKRFRPRLIADACAAMVYVPRIKPPVSSSVHELSKSFVIRNMCRETFVLVL